MIREGTVPYLGRETYYRIAGPGTRDKTPILLLHGGPGSTHNYFEILDGFAEQDGRQLISHDQIGCGRSYLEGRPELWTMETWIGELKVVRHALGLDRVILLGQSWGGMLLLEYLCRHEHRGVTGAVLSSTLPSSRLWGLEQERMIRQLPKPMQEAIRKATESNDYSNPDYQAAEDFYMELHSAGPFGPDAPECLTRPKQKGRESYLCGWGPNEFTPTGSLKDFDVTDRLPGVDVPVLIVSGGSDLCTPFIAKTMYDAIPDAEWELFRNCRHMCFAEEPERYCAVLYDWLQRKRL
jgi:proline iminopeptidase